MPKYRVQTKAGNSYDLDLAEGEDIESAIAEIEASEARAPVAVRPAPIAPKVAPARAPAEEGTPVYDMVSGVQTGYESTPRGTTLAEDAAAAKREQWVTAETARLKAINPEKPDATFRALAESRYVADPKPAAPVDRVQQYRDRVTNPSVGDAGAKEAAQFDEKLQTKVNTKFQKAAPDVRGDRIGTAYNPNAEREAAAKQNQAFTQQREDAEMRARGESMGPVMRGLAKGALQTKGFGEGLIGFVGDAIGEEDVKQWGITAYNNTMHQLGNMPAKEFTGLETADDVKTYLAETMSYGAFQAAQSILTGMVGGFVGKQVGKEVVGQIVGLAASNVATELGMIYGDAQEEAARTGKPPPSLAQVATGAIAAAAIDTFADKIGMDSITRAGFKGSALTRIGKSVGMQMGVQGGTEMAQKVPEELGAGKDPFRKGILNDYINEGAAGAVMGGGPGAAGAIRRAGPETINFTNPDSPTAQAGLVPIVIPNTPAPTGEQDVSTDSAPGPLAPIGGGPAGSVDAGGVAGAGLPAADTGGRLVPGPEITQPGDVAPALPAAGAAEQPAPVGLPRVAERATDADLMARVTGALPPVQENNTPATVMMGRSGAGYATEKDAQVAQQVGAKREPGMDWRIEPMAEGRFRVAAYGKTDTVAGEQIDKDWTAFAPESGTLNIPRAEMPQIKAEHRGAMTNFLKARGIESEQDSVAADSLKPTQAEFSQEKVEKAKGYVGGDRSILVSADGHVLDGHHQWLAKRDTGEDVKVIRLKAPISELMAAVKEFPSAQQSDGAQAYNAETTATQETGNGRTDIGAAGPTVAGPAQAIAGGAQADGNVSDPAAVAPNAGNQSQPAAGTTSVGSEQVARPANLKLAIPAPAPVAAKVIARMAKDGYGTLAVQPAPTNDAQFAASAIGRILGRTVTFVTPSAPGTKAIPNAFVMPGQENNIYVASNADDAPVRLVFHEAVHTLPDALKRTLVRQLGTTFDQSKRGEFAREFDYAESDANFDEEIAAFITQAVSGREGFLTQFQAKLKNKEFRGAMGVVLANLKNIVKKLTTSDSYGDAFVKKYVTDVQRAIDLVSNAMAAQANAQADQVSAVPVAPTKEAALKQQIEAAADADPVVAAEAAPVKQTETPAFKKWFGDSKVVDADGKPLVVFHGTRGDIAEFSPEAGAELSPFSLGNKGLYFSKNPSYANVYARSRDGKRNTEGGNILPVYLKIQNPFVIDGEISFDERMSSAYVNADRIEELKARGYDGIINDSAQEIIAFDAAQVKSATGNAGTFDGKNPDITKSQRAESGIPPKFWARSTVPHDVYIADEDVYETIDVPADQALASAEEDVDSLRALLDCMRGK